MRICYFGTYSMEKGYPRNRVIIEGLRRNGVEVVECHEDFWTGTDEKLEGVKDISSILKKLLRLLWTYVRLIRKFMKAGSYDAVVVGYAGHIDIFLARFLNIFRRKPLIFDAFLSLYDTAVMDRGLVSSGSFKAEMLQLLDTWACRTADAVLLDTQGHVDYFVREFRLSPHKFYVIPVGSTLPVGHPLPPSRRSIPLKGGERGDLFQVLHFGSYIPLHGVNIIIEAAKILEAEKDILFTLIGKGQLLSEMKELASRLGLKNVAFIDRFVEERELVEYIQRADICLGIFGNTEKAFRVIPCKVYDCLALGKPIITAATPAAEDILIHKKNAFLCNPGDPSALAEAIRFLKGNKALREEIGLSGRKCFQEEFSVESIGRRVLEVVCHAAEK